MTLLEILTTAEKIENTLIQFGIEDDLLTKIIPMSFVVNKTIEVVEGNKDGSRGYFDYSEAATAFRIVSLGYNEILKSQKETSMSSDSEFDRFVSAPLAKLKLLLAAKAPQAQNFQDETSHLQNNGIVQNPFLP